MTDLPPAIAELLTAWTARDWYGLAVINVYVVMRVLTSTGVWDRVPTRWQWAVPVLLGAVHGWGGAYYEGATLPMGLLQGGAAALQIGLGAAGVHHALKRVRGSDLPKWPTTGLLVLLLTVGCHDMGPCTAADAADLDARYTAELMAACHEYPSLQECPEFERISAEDTARREEFVQCR